MTSAWTIVGIVGFGLSAAAYLVIGIILITANPGSRQANWLLAAVLVSLAWSATLLYLIGSAVELSWLIPIVDAAYLAAWVAALAEMMRVPVSTGQRRYFPRLLLIASMVLVLVVAIATLVAGPAGANQGRGLAFAGLLAIPLLGVLAIEQIYRNAEFRQRRVWMPIALAIGSVFAANIFVYSQAVLFGDVLAGVWSLRGLVSALVAPLIVVGVKRQPDWENRLFVSRQIVFYTTTLTAAGIYLIAMAIGGYYVGTRGMAWGPALQTAFLLCSGAVLLYAMFSVDLRARLKVFIAKHFYRNRYDYREEWLRLIETLASAGDGESPVARGIEALASIVGSRSGELWWLNSEGSRYEARPGWNMSALADDFSVDDSVVAFLDSRRWVIDTKECASNPELYANAFIGDERFSSVPSIFVPLVHENRLTGIVRLDRPVGIGKLGFEDHDLLKTAGQQVAIFLAQEEAKERLSETRQLEAFSKFTTFLMHDLKNVIAQQDLVVANAKRYGDRPEFVEDAIRTIGASVKRMRRILARLTSGFASEDISNVDLGKLLRDVCSNCADREPPPRLVEIDDELVVAINRERLAMALTHAIRNAQDATDADGRIELRLKSEGTMAVIEVNDTGVGMEAEFIHERLFKPFDSTKGAQGMGIGAYQLRETLRAVDGEVEVSSTPGRGTTLRMRLPVDPNSSPAETGT